MIRRQQDASIGQEIFSSVAECIGTLAGDYLPPQQVVEIGFKTDSSERHDDAQIFQTLKFSFEIRSAVSELLRQRLVVRRRAARRRGYIKIGEHEAVIAVGGRRLIRKANFVQHRIHKLAGSVSGERPPGAVRAMSAGSQSKHQHARFGIAESRNRFAPVLMVAVSAALLASNELAIGDQPRAARAADDLGIQNLEPVGQMHSLLLYWLV